MKKAWIILICLAIPSCACMRKCSKDLNDIRKVNDINAIVLKKEAKKKKAAKQKLNIKCRQKHDSARKQ